MDIESLREYCLAKKGVTESFPFDEDTLVFKVMNKMFCLAGISSFDRMNLKCDPVRAVELRESHDCVLPGWHMNKHMWNTIIIDGSVSRSTLEEWIDHSYEQVKLTLPKKAQKELSEL